MTKKSKAALAKQINETKARIAALREAQAPTSAYGLAALMESELDKATLVVAVKGISDELQSMAEKMAKMEADEIMPILDSLKAAFGPEMTEAFNAAATQSIRTAMDAVKAAKDAIGNEILRLEGVANGEDVSDMAMAPEPAADADPMADPMAGNDMAADPMAAPADPMAADPAAGGDMGAELDMAGGDDLADDTLQDPAAGRARKESAAFRHASNPDKFVFEAVVSRVKGGMKGPEAARMVAENLGLELSDVVEIVAENRSVKKK